MTKYDFMFIEQQIDYAGNLFLDGELREILPILDDIIIMANQMKSDIVRDTQ